MWFFTHVWIVPALMVLSFLLILLFGKKMPKKGSEIGIFFVGLALIFSICTAVNWWDWSRGGPEVTSKAAEASALSEVQPKCSKVATEARLEAAEKGKAQGKSVAAAAAGGAEKGGEPEIATRPVVRCLSWFETGKDTMTIGTLVDGQSVLMLVVVTIISLLVHIFSTDYVGGDRRYTHYFAFLSLFTASMLFFVLGQSTLQLIVGWELVGVCSFALIGHWWEEKPNTDAAMKAFLTNRVGDVGLLVGMTVLFFAADRSFSVLDINILANEGKIRHIVLLAAACCLITAVMSKSGQFILHTWLPDAMAGPTPVSALIHAATMVVAGLANLPPSLQIVDVPGPWATRFEKFVEPVGLYFPAISHAGFNLGLALVSVVVGLSGIVVSYLYFWKGSFRWAQGLSGRNKLAGTGKRILENKYYFDWLYTDVITGFVKGPLANATNWFNQRVVDGVVNGVGRGAVGTGQWVYKNVDQKVVDGTVNGIGAGAGATGGVLRHLQSGKVQQYAALFFIAAAVLTGVFVVAIG